MSRQDNLQRSLRLLRYGAATVFIGAAVTQARVQIINRDEVLGKAKESKRFRIERPEIAKRGDVVSSDGKTLAEDLDGRYLTVDFRKVPKSRGFFMALATATGIPASDLANKADLNRAVKWDRNYSTVECARIEKVKRAWRADGVGLSASGQRRFLLGPATAGILGYYRQGKPQGGIELAQNLTLTGKNGKTIGMVDKDGAFLPMKLDRESTPKRDGKEIGLTINASLQRAAYETVKEAVLKHRADSGIAIVIEPKTGNLRAMVNYPSFDPSQPLPVPAKGQVSADFSPSYQATFEPGSTFKVLTIAKAIDMGLATPGSSIVCNGQIQVADRLIRCDAHGGNRAHGTISSESAIARSCNVSAATWAMRVGYKDLISYVEDLGLLRRTGIGLPRESKGIFQYGEYAKRLQLANLGFGQSISVSPVALAGAFAVLASDGKEVKPKLIERIGDLPSPNLGSKQILQPETAHQVLRMMRSVIESESGTGHALRISGLDLGGKTGTAQKRNGAQKGYVSNFVGFVPAERPEAVVLVMIDNPRGKEYYGGQVAGPAFVKIAKAVVDHLEIAATHDDRNARITLPRMGRGTSEKAVKIRAPKVDVVATRVPDWKEIDAKNPPPSVTTTSSSAIRMRPSSKRRPQESSTRRIAENISTASILAVANALADHQDKLTSQKSRSKSAKPQDAKKSERTPSKADSNPKSSTIAKREPSQSKLPRRETVATKFEGSPKSAVRKETTVAENRKSSSPKVEGSKPTSKRVASKPMANSPIRSKVENRTVKSDPKRTSTKSSIASKESQKPMRDTKRVATRASNRTISKPKTNVTARVARLDGPVRLSFAGQGLDSKKSSTRSKTAVTSSSRSKAKKPKQQP